MITVYYDDAKTSYWTPFELGLKIESLIDAGTLDGDMWFVKFEEKVPSNDGGKTICDNYVPGGMCLLYFVDKDYIKGGAITLRRLVQELKSKKVCLECGENEGIGMISVNKETLESDYDVDTICKHSYVMRI